MKIPKIFELPPPSDCFMYTPDNKRLEPENTPLEEKEKHRLKPPPILGGSMFVLGGVNEISQRPFMI